MAVDPEREQVAAHLRRLQRAAAERLRAIAARVEGGIGGVRTVVTAPPPSPVHVYQPWRALVGGHGSQGEQADLHSAAAWIQLRLQRFGDGVTTDFTVAFHLFHGQSSTVVAASLFVRRVPDFRKAAGAGNERLWGVAEVAAFLKVSKDWVYRRAASGDLPSKKVGSLLRFARSEVVDWCDELASGAEVATPVSDVEPLVLDPSEAKEEQSARLSRWLDKAMVVALTEWKRS